MCLLLALRLQRFFCVLVLAASGLLAACQATPGTSGTSAQVLHYLWTRDEQTGALDPRVEYMRVEINGRKTLLGLQERRSSPGPHGPVVDEYWYSSQREMLHLRNGRIHVVLGTSTQWVSNHSQPPAWSQVQAALQALRWQRLRDEQPGARTGLNETVITTRVPAPPHLAAAASTPALDWYSDQVSARTPDGRPWSHTQWFGLLNGAVVDSEQCIAPDLCLRLQRITRP